MTSKQELDGLLSFSAKQLAVMQDKKWSDLDKNQIDFLERFIACSLAVLVNTQPDVVLRASVEVSKLKSNLNIREIARSKGVPDPTPLFATSTANKEYYNEQK